MSEAVLSVNHLSIGYGQPLCYQRCKLHYRQGRACRYYRLQRCRQEYAFENNPRHVAEAER